MFSGKSEELIRRLKHEGFVEVEGKQNIRPVLGKIASQTGLTARQVQSRISSALGKIARTLKHCEQVPTASAHVDF
jgi:thymidine kinase